MHRFMSAIQPQLLQYLADHPLIANCGEDLKLTSLLHDSVNLFYHILETSKQEFATAHPAAADLLEYNVIQRHRPLCRRNAPGGTNPASYAAATHMHSNRVNVRFFDAAGSLYFILYDGGLITPSLAFHDGYHIVPAQHVANMVQIAQSIPRDTTSLFIHWLQARPPQSSPMADNGHSSDSQSEMSVEVEGSQASVPEVTTPARDSGDENDFSCEIRVS